MCEFNLHNLYFVIEILSQQETLLGCLLGHPVCSIGLLEYMIFDNVLQIN